MDHIRRFFDIIEPYLNAAGKLCAVWGVTLYGVMTLHNLAVLLGATYSAMQIYILWKNNFRKKPEDK